MSSADENAVRDGLLVELSAHYQKIHAELEMSASPLYRWKSEDFMKWIENALTRFAHSS
jgi:hypothetical protein